MKFELKRLDSSFLGDLLSLQDDAFRHLGDPEMLRPNSAEVFLECLEKHHTLGIFHEKELIAFGILYFGKGTPENLGHDLGVPKNLLFKVANVKLIIVRHDFRGQGLQRFIIGELEKKAQAMGYEILACTVSPKNHVSIRDFLLSGFVFWKQTPKYGVLLRNVYYKRI